jgi:hypothetical protein
VAVGSILAMGLDKLPWRGYFLYSMIAETQTPTKKIRKRGSQARLPIAPLISMWDPGTDLGTIAEACGFTRASLRHWMESGLSVHRADEVACHLGKHPSNVWGQAWWDIARELA